jgi:hypothetical protein
MSRRLLIIALIAVVSVACSGDSDGSHTTATTFVSPPPQQVLHSEIRFKKHALAEPDDPKLKVDPKKPLLILNVPRNGQTFREGEEVVLDFSLANAYLKAEGGNYRVRYIVDDDDMQWVDQWDDVVLTGWTSGKHTIRMELIGPDGWPYRNGDYNIITRELTVVK